MYLYRDNIRFQGLFMGPGQGVRGKCRGLYILTWAIRNPVSMLWPSLPAAGRRVSRRELCDLCNPWSEACEHDWSGNIGARTSANQRRVLTGDWPMRGRHCARPESLTIGRLSIHEYDSVRGDGARARVSETRLKEDWPQTWLKRILSELVAFREFTNTRVFLLLLSRTL